MNEEAQLVLESTEDDMQKAVSHLESELVKIRAGRANPSMLEGLSVDYYGSRTALSQISNVSTPDPRTIVIQPWEKSMLTPIEKAIQAANLGFNPQNDGIIIRIAVPPLTEERRKDLVKKAKSEGESAKVVIRNARKEANEEIKRLVKAGLPEDEGKSIEEKIQKLTDLYSGKADNHLETKEKEIMTI